jgi:hypothetical protein
MRTTIGANYEAALRDLNLSYSEYYVPYATSAMSCETLNANQEKLSKQIQGWNDILGSLTYGLFSGDREKATNIGKILDIQTTKLEGYLSESEKCLMITAAGNGTEPIAEVPPPAGGSSNNSLLWIAVAVGGFFLVRKFSKRKRRR